MSRVLLLSDVNTEHQERMVTDLSTAIVGPIESKLQNGIIIKKDSVDLAKTLNFLRGTKEERTGNIGEEITRSIDPGTESLRDFVLRHALIMPVASTIKIDMSNASAMLRYTIEVKALEGLEKHSLFPPAATSPSELLWDPFRSMHYLSPLQRKLEYEDALGHLASVGPNSLEDDEKTCLPSVIVRV